MLGQENLRGWIGIGERIVGINEVWEVGKFEWWCRKLMISYTGLLTPATFAGCRIPRLTPPFFVLNSMIFFELVVNGYGLTGVFDLIPSCWTEENLWPKRYGLESLDFEPFEYSMGPWYKFGVLLFSLGVKVRFMVWIKFQTETKSN